MRFSGAVLASVLAVLGLLGVVGPLLADGASLDGSEQDLVARINSFRASRGLPTLAVSDTLSAAAKWMSFDMGARNYFAHTSLDGRSPTQRMYDAGYPAFGTWTGEGRRPAGLRVPRDLDWTEPRSDRRHRLDRDARARPREHRIPRLVQRRQRTAGCHRNERPPGRRSLGARGRLALGESRHVDDDRLRRSRRGWMVRVHRARARRRGRLPVGSSWCRGWGELAGGRRHLLHDPRARAARRPNQPQLRPLMMGPLG